MPSPRQNLLIAVEACLLRIHVADGYNTDAGDAVTLEPAPVVAEDDSEFITVVWSRQARPTTPAVQRTHRLTTFEIVAKLPATLTNAQGRLDAIVSDIEDAMADQQFRYPNGYSFPEYQSAEPLAGAITAGWVGVVLTYTSHIPIKPATTP